MMKDRLAAGIGAATFAVHMAVANRYDLFRDELYFIVCGQHPAFGYADQPPLVPLLSATFYALGHQTWLVRLPGALAAAGTVWLAIAFVRLLGGRSGAAFFAGIAAGLAPVLMGVTGTLNTESFEPLAWTAVAYALARAAVLDDRRALVAAGIVAGLAMEAKYALPLWLTALAIGLLATPQRIVLARREVWIGLGISAIIALPSVVWQATHQWPFIELVRNAGDKNASFSPLAYMINQIAIVNPVAAPLWIAALIVPFIAPALRPVRFIAIAYVVAAVATIAGGGKDYYLAPTYPALLAIGAVALERGTRFPILRIAHAVALVLVAMVAAPLALPILDPPALIAYQRALHIAPQAQETNDTNAALPSTFQDMLGWHDFERQVADAYRGLTPVERRDTAILVANYGEAAALDIYGAADGLPPAFSGHNQYGLWALRGETARNVVRVQRNPARLRPYCATMRVIATAHSPYARSFENGLSISYCAGVHPALSTLWPTIVFLE